MDTIECLVVGAGVIGLAVARALARAGREVIVVESESGIGAGVSSRNSEVIHAGIYYRTGLDKTRLCVDGKAMLYAFCRWFGVPHKRCGKLLVAVNAGEIAKLTGIKAQAEAHGVMFAFETPILAGHASGHGLVIEVGGPAPTRLAAGLVVNAAGLSAQ